MVWRKVKPENEANLLVCKIQDFCRLFFQVQQIPKPKRGAKIRMVSPLPYMMMMILGGIKSYKMMREAGCKARHG